MARTQTPKTTAPKTTKTTAPKRRKATAAGSVAAQAAAAAAAADTPPAPVEGVGCWLLLPTKGDAIAAAAEALSRWAPLAEMPGRRSALWVTIGGLPQNRRGLCIDGAIGAVARRALADIAKGLQPAAVPVFWSVAAPEERGAASLDNPEHLTLDVEWARRFPGEATPQPVGWLPTSSVNGRQAAAVAAGTGVNVSRKTVSAAVKAVGKWAARWASEDADPAALADSGTRRSAALRLHGATDKADKAALRKVLGEARAVNTVATIQQKHGAEVIAQGIRRATAAPVEAPVRRPVSV